MRRSLFTTRSCADFIDELGLPVNATPECKCKEDFELQEDWEGDVFMYYGLTNFYQNHRRYVKSRDDRQLLGQDLDKAPSKDCAPFDKDKDTGLPYVPCGAIANSMFSGVCGGVVSWLK